jgi:hypothetical protein
MNEPKINGVEPFQVGRDARWRKPLTDALIPMWYGAF